MPVTAMPPPPGNHPQQPYYTPPIVRKKGLGGCAIAAIVLAGLCAFGGVVSVISAALNPRPPSTVLQSPTTADQPDKFVPTADQRAYIEALRQIDPNFVPTNGRAVINDAENTCLDLAQGGLTHEQLVNRVIQRVERLDARADAAQAERIMKLMQNWICPSWATTWASRHPATPTS